MFHLPVHNIWHHLLNLLYPLKCLSCGTYLTERPFSGKPGLEANFCSACMTAGSEISLRSPFCPLCAEPLPDTGGRNHLCERCLKTPLKLNKVRAAGRYKGVLKQAVQQLKYRSELCVSGALEQMLFEAYQHHFSSVPIQMILPVPLHRSKTLSRGFNQSFLLVRHFMEKYTGTFQRPPSWQINTSALVRVKKTVPQAGLDIDTRKKNLKNAFRVATPEAIKNRHLLLVDDVLTTGATCDAAATALLESGAATVDALVLART